MTRALPLGRLLVIGLAVATSACSGAPSAEPSANPAGGQDGASSGSLDSGSLDSGSLDSGSLDSGSLDSAPSTSTEVSTTTTLPPLPTVRLDVPDAPEGFAGMEGLSGGFGRENYVIDSADDSGPGSYRDALSSGDRHIVFDPSMDGRTIMLERDVDVVGSNITLDGSGVDVVVSRYSTKFSGTNIIVAGMTYRDVDAGDNEDAVTFVDASETQVVGLFNNVFSHASDGLVDFIWNRGNDVYATVCGNRFEHHDKAMLVHSGRSDREGGTYHLTLCHNVWSDVYQRTPFTRDALVHQYNSVFERYGKANGDGGGSKAGVAETASQHLLESNVAIPRRIGEETFDGTTVGTPRTEWAGPHLDQDAAVRISDTLLETVDGVTATEHEQHPDQVFEPPYPYRLAPASEATRDAILATAGRCEPSGRERIVPCAPLLLLGRGENIVVFVDGEVSKVELDLGGTMLDASAEGAGAWAVTFTQHTDVPRTLRAIATTPDGRTVTSSPVVVAVVG